MENLFQKALIFGDIHFGAKNNERQFNIDCENFINWLVNVAKDKKVDAIIFLGDWHHNRNSIHLSTLNYSLSNLERLNNIGIPVYFIPGNHDEKYKDKRELSSIEIGRNLTNLIIFNDITKIHNTLFCPWLVGDEWKKVAALSTDVTYVFGHFELPKFKMNSMVEMSENGQLKGEDFDIVKGIVFSGHFHKRQSKGRVLYIGNAFPHDFGDAWDDDRGLVILEWGKTPEFIKWDEAPNYKTLKMSEFLDGFDLYLNDRTYAKIHVDIDLNTTDLQFIKEIFLNHYNPRKLELIPTSTIVEDQFDDTSLDFKSVDQIVIEGLKSIDSVSMNVDILIDLYMSLE